MSTAAALATKTCPRCGGTFDHVAVFCPKDGTRLEADGDGAQAEHDPYIGMVLSGDIEIRSVAGSGAMGRVYRAHQRGIDRDVAVKILHRELSGNAHLVQRFHREAKIASKLQHPHVVEVYLAGQLPDRALYIVMEYLDGMSLAAAIEAAGGWFSPERALPIALQLCDAVGEGHARGIVHRDLKPENVMLVRRAEASDWVKVLDFGIAKVSLGEQSMETAAGLIFGTARYISPEGAQGAAVGPQGDVYSLATMVYQMLAGRTPFDAEQPVGLLIKHIHEKPPPLGAWPRGASIHEALARVVMDNLGKEPSSRAPSARAFASALAAAAKAANVSFSDVGVVARLSSVDLRSYARTNALDATMDDATAVPAVVPVGTPFPLPRVSVPAPPDAVAISPAMTPATAPAIRPARTPASTPAMAPGLAPANAPAIETPGAGDHHVGASAPDSLSSKDSLPTAAPAERRRGSLVVVLLAFLLGAALAVIVTQRLGKGADETRAAHVSRARRALSDSRYTSPPGDNVRDLVASGLATWPDDNDLRQIRSDAAHEMVTRSMASRSAGDVSGARDLAQGASALDVTDHSARMLLEQYQGEAAAMLTEAGMYVGAPKLTFEVPAIARPGQRIELVARIAPGSAGPKAKITSTRMTVFDNGKATGGTVVPFVQSDPREARATLVAPQVGSYDVVFETKVNDVVIRAVRDLDIVPPDPSRP